MNRLLLLILTTFTVISCSKNEPTTQEEVQLTPEVEFNIEPNDEILPYNSNININWSIINASSATLNGETIDLSGEKSYLNMTKSQEFIIVATNISKTTTVTKTVKIDDEPTSTTFTIDGRLYDQILFNKEDRLIYFIRYNQIEYELIVYNYSSKKIVAVKTIEAFDPYRTLNAIGEFNGKKELYIRDSEKINILDAGNLDLIASIDIANTRSIEQINGLIFVSLNIGGNPVIHVYNRENLQLLNEVTEYVGNLARLAVFPDPNNQDLTLCLNFPTSSNESLIRNHTFNKNGEVLTETLFNNYESYPIRNNLKSDFMLVGSSGRVIKKNNLNTNIFLDTITPLTDYWISENGDEIYSIQNYNIIEYETTNFTRVNTFEIPVSGENIFSTDDEIIMIDYCDILCEPTEVSIYFYQK